jgi:hypothetical protein
MNYPYARIRCSATSYVSPKFIDRSNNYLDFISAIAPLVIAAIALSVAFGR